MPAEATKSAPKSAKDPEKVQESTNLHLREQVGIVRDDVRDLARAAGDAAVGQLDPIEDYVREKPIKSLLIAAGIGALFGMIFLRR